MLHKILLRMCEEKFGADAFNRGDPPAPAMTFPSAHPAVGEATVRANGQFEAIITIGDITHGHFYSFDMDASHEEREHEVAEWVVEFLVDLFADKYLLWRSLDGRAGGWSQIDSLSDYAASLPRASRFEREAEWFLWSGPVSLS